MDEAPTLTRRRVYGRFINALAGKRPADNVPISTRELMLVWPAPSLPAAAERFLRDEGLPSFEVARISASAVFFRKKAGGAGSLTQQGSEPNRQAAE